MPGAVLLADGGVLVSGGFDRASPHPYERLATTEFYDPAADRWTLVGSMNEPRAGHDLVLLRDGKVLAVGGAPGAAEVFDPVTRAWSVVPAGSPGRVGATVVSMPDGRVAVAGGDFVRAGPAPGSEYYESTPSMDVYDPPSGRWSSGPVAAQVRNLAAGAASDDGTIVIVGGNRYESALIPWELFGDRPGPRSRATRGIDYLEPGAAAWRTAEWPAAWGGTGAAAAGLSPHEVLLLAGSGPGSGSSSAAVFDTRNGRWTKTASMRVARSGAIAIRWKAGCVFVMGGAGPSDPAEVYSARDRAWRAVPHPPNAGAQVALRLGNDEILALSDHDRPRDAFRYRPAGAVP